MIQRATFSNIPEEDARTFGVHAGPRPTTADAGLELLRRWNSVDRWCAPLVIAGACEVYDFTQGYDAHRELKTLFGLGRYNEDRAGMYETAIFKTSADPAAESRTVHVGLDIGAAEGTPIFAPLDAMIASSEILAADGDYGGTLTLKCVAPKEVGLEADFYMLLGHLSHATVARWKTGDRVAKGELLGWLGNKKENGGWNPHLHWQLSWLKPVTADLPGAVTRSRRDSAGLVFPDPTVMLKLALAGW